MSGWEPAEFHEHVYEGDRLVGSVVTREPEWCEADRVSVIAELERRRLVGPHGQPMDEATSPLADPSSWDAEWGYKTALIVDYAQAAYDRDMEELKKKYGDRLPNGLTLQVRKVMRA